MTFRAGLLSELSPRMLADFLSDYRLMRGHMHPTRPPIYVARRIALRNALADAEQRAGRSTR